MDDWDLSVFVFGSGERERERERERDGVCISDISCLFDRVSQLLSFKDLGCPGINFGS